MNLMYNDFFKSLTLVYPWKPRPMDIAYIQGLTPPTIFKKILISEGSIKDTILNNPKVNYTTIVMNSIDEVLDIMSDPNKYRTDASVILLRNSSENSEKTYDENKKVIYKELKNREILTKLIDKKTGYLKCRTQFARFFPERFTTEKLRSVKFLNQL